MELEKVNLILLSGRPAAGKSHAIRYIMLNLHSDYSKNPVKYAVVFTTTAYNGSFDYIPNGFVHNSYKPEILEEVIRIQQSTGGRHHAAVIWDDVLPSGAFNSDLVVQLFTTFRHLNITAICSTQYIYKLSPTLRECATRVLLFRTVTQRSVKALYESFGQYFKNEKDFSNYLLKNTNNYRFVLFKANSQSDKISEIYSVLKCPAQIPQFKYVY